MCKRIVVCLLALLAVQAVLAQTVESLLIGPGDLVHVRVFDTPELEQQARVSDAGTIPLAVGGEVKVGGLTPTAAARVIESTLRDRKMLLKPQVLVNVDEYATQRVSVLGEVKQPGAYAIGTPRSVLQVISLAGGISDLADRRILVEHHATGERVSYFISNNAKDALDSAVKVDPGDTVIVPRAGIVYALGDVRAPGGYTMTNNESKLTVLELVARAGGTNHTAREGHARLIRKTEHGLVEIPLALKDMQKGKTQDISLQPNDVIFVPFSYAKNLVTTGNAVLASASSAAIYRF